MSLKNSENYSLSAKAAEILWLRNEGLCCLDNVRMATQLGWTADRQDVQYPHCVPGL